MDSDQLRLLERKFDLQGKMSPETLQEGRALLIEDVAEAFAAGDVTPSEKKDLRGVEAFLRSDKFSGNEAGAAVFETFAATEVEEALRRRSSGQQIPYLLYRFRWHHRPHSFTEGDFPVHLAIESTSVCDLKCKMCFQTDPLMQNDPKAFGYMEMDLYRKIIDEGADKGLSSVKLSIRGEPTLHPELPEMISYARAKGILDVMFNSNANQLNEVKAKAIIDACPTLVIFSIDSMDKNRFEGIRRGAKFERVIGNVERFLALRKDSAHGRNIKVRVQMTLLPEAEADVAALKEYWVDKVDQVAVKGVLTRMHKQPVTADKPCRVLWQRMDIHWNGDVWLCDNDYLGKLALGNVRERSIEEIWHGDMIKELRRKHRCGSKNSIDPCKFCDGL